MFVIAKAFILCESANIFSGFTVFVLYTKPPSSVDHTDCLINTFEKKILYGVLILFIQDGGIDEDCIDRYSVGIIHRLSWM